MARPRYTSRPHLPAPAGPRSSNMPPPIADPKDPLPLVLIVLSAVTGLVDAVSVLGLGQVFVANMTGNTVFLGFAVGGGAGVRGPALRHGAPGVPRRRPGRRVGRQRLRPVDPQAVAAD